MRISLVPDGVYESYQQITPELLQSRGIRLLLSDLDYTLAPKSVSRPDQAVRDWLSRLQAAGIRVMILSNNRSSHRVETFCRELGIPYVGHAQAPLLATACVADVTTVFVENIFENRYRHIPELVRMGAAVKTEGKVAVVEGVEILYGASVEAPDLRGGAALVVAGLCAEGKTEIGGVEYIERGYECIESTLTSIGADIKKI